MAVTAFVHKKPASDPELKAEANGHFANSRAKQVIAKLIVLMRAAQLPNMTDKDMHNRFPPTERMRWYEQRPDLRCEVVMDLVRLREHMARKRSLLRQAEDIEEALVEDITYKEYEMAFDVEDLATYGDCDAYVRFFVEGFDWTKGDEKSRPLIGVLLNEFLTAPGQLKSPLTHLQARRAISSVAWQTYVPTDLRAKVDDARLAKQTDSPREPFTAKDELEIVTTVLLAKHLPLAELKPIFLAAMKALGFEVPIPKPEDTQPSAADADGKDEPTAGSLGQEGSATSVESEAIDADSDPELQGAIRLEEAEENAEKTAAEASATADGTEVFSRALATVPKGSFDAARDRSAPSSGPGLTERSSQGGVRLEDLKKEGSVSGPIPPPRPSQTGDAGPPSRRVPPPKVVVPERKPITSKS